jgi:phage-related protein
MEVSVTNHGEEGSLFMIVHTYLTAGGKDLIREYLESLNKEEKAEGYKILSLLENGNLEDLNSLDLKPIEGKVWEIRFRRHNRLFYVLSEKENIYLLHGCKKQKNATENKDKALAIKRAKELR